MIPRAETLFKSTIENCFLDRKKTQKLLLVGIRLLKFIMYLIENKIKM